MSTPLAISLTGADGNVKRLGPDEWQSGDIPQSLTFSSVMPGGYKDCTFNLPRRIDLQQDIGLFDDVKVYAPGGQTVWEGRIARLPRSHGDTYSQQVSAVGYQAHLTDHKQPFLFVDVDKSHWEGPSVQRVLDTGSQYANSGPNLVQDPDGGEPALQLAVQGLLGASPGLALCEGWYNSRNQPIASLYYAWKRGTNLSHADTQWTWVAALADDAQLSGSNDSTANLRAAGPSTGTLSATTASRKYALVQLRYGTSGGAESVNYDLYWTTLAAYGDHGLTKQGTASATEAQGFYASDMIGHILTTAAPLVTYTSETLQTSGFVVPHAVWQDPVTAWDAIMGLNAYHQWDFAVWDDRTFHFGPSDPNRLTWEARLDEGVHLELEGDDTESLFNGVVVHWTEPDGKKKSAGPLGSGLDAEDATLQDTSVTNPVNSHGIARKWAELDITPVTTQAGAIQIGAMYLAEKSLPQKKGSMTLKRVTHPTKGPISPVHMRAGDFVRVADHPADDARKIDQATFSNDEKAMTVTFGGGGSKVEAILERFGIRNVGTT